MQFRNMRDPDTDEGLGLRELGQMHHEPFLPGQSGRHEPYLPESGRCCCEEVSLIYRPPWAIQTRSVALLFSERTHTARLLRAPTLSIVSATTRGVLKDLRRAGFIAKAEILAQSYQRFHFRTRPIGTRQDL